MKTTGFLPSEPWLVPAKSSTANTVTQTVALLARVEGESEKGRPLDMWTLTGAFVSNESRGSPAQVIESVPQNH